MVGTISWFITGASRGIGLEFVRQLISDTSNIVIASCRNPNTAGGLIDMKASAKGQLHIVKLEVTAEDTIKAAVEEASMILGGQGLDYLLNNAGVNPAFDGAFDFDVATFATVMQSNVIGPAIVTKCFLPLLERGNKKVVMNMSSGLGSIGLDCGSKCCTYSMSKSALNMLTYKQAKEQPEISIIVIDPGWVKTAMGGEGAVLEPAESVTPLIGFLKEVSREQSGKFFNYRGELLPW